MLSLITLFLAAMFYYVKNHFLNICLLPNIIKNFLTIFLFLGIFNIQITLLIGHKLSFVSVLILSCANLLLIYFFTATIFVDILKIFFKNNLKYILRGFVIVLPLLTVFAVYNATKFPEVKTINFKINKNENLKKLNIVLLSDLHVNKHTNEKRIKDIIFKVNSLNPDIVVITGDSIDDTPNMISEKLTSLKDLTAPTYMVFGNHEYYHDSNAWKKYFKSLKITLLENDSIVIKNKTYQVVLAGIDIEHFHDEKKEYKLIKKVLNKQNEQNILPTILLTHYPKTFNCAKNENIFLQLSGHTHGGITFPISFIVKWFNGGYLKGLYKNNSSYLYVSPGTSLWEGMPAKLGCKNEITNIIIENN